MGDPLSQNAAPYPTAGDATKLTLKVQGTRKRERVRVTRVDAASTSFKRAFERMGSPAYPTNEQVEELRHASEQAPPELMTTSPQGEITVAIPPNSVALLEWR